MADRISTLPDKLLCHILSFLPTKKAVATSVLSKRWKPLWRSVPALDFDDYFYDDNKETSFRFVQSVYTAIVSRDLRQPIQRLSLRCGFSEIFDLINVDIWVNTAVQCGLEHLDLCPNWTWSTFNLSPVITCRTLVILKLDQLFVGVFSSVDLPCLKILHFGTVRFIKPVYLANFLSGCPVLEILKVNNVFFENDMAEAEFKCLPKLLRAHIDGLDNSMLKAVKNVEFLDIDRVDAMYYYLEVDNKDFISDTMFSNLTHIELSYIRYDNRDWPLLLEALNNCPKLQVLVIDKPAHFSDDEEIGGDWPYPQSVPTCIMLRLKKCHLKAYDGMKGEFRFVRYIMQNARFLRRMIICSYSCVTRREKLKMIKKLSLCTRRSATCKLSFK